MTKKRKKATTDLSRMSKKSAWLTLAEKKMVNDGGYFDTEGVLHNSEGLIRCTAMVKSSGYRCKNFAVPGESVCRIHGGLSLRNKARKGRLYSIFLKNPQISIMHESMLEDKEVAGVTEELALLRTLLAYVVDQLNDGEGPGLRDLKNIASITGEIRQLVGDCTNSQIKLGQLIDIGKVTIIINQLAQIIQKHVTDKEVLLKIAAEFDNLIWPAASAQTPQPDRRKSVGSLPRPS